MNRGPWALAHAPDAFGSLNVIFYTREGGEVSVARRRSFAPLRPWAETSQRFAASRRFAFKNLNEVSRAATCPQKSVPQRRLSRSRVSARLRRAMARTIDTYSASVYIFSTLGNGYMGKHVPHDAATQPSKPS